MPSDHEPQTGPTPLEALYAVRESLTGTPPHRPDRFTHPTLPLYPVDIDHPPPHRYEFEDRSIPQVPRVYGLGPDLAPRYHGLKVDYVAFDEDPKATLDCTMLGRPRPTVFDRSRGEKWLLWLSLFALVAVGVWIGILVGVGWT